jgi:hypothetical protein
LASVTVNGALALYVSALLINPMIAVLVSAADTRRRIPKTEPPPAPCLMTATFWQRCRVSEPVMISEPCPLCVAPKLAVNIVWAFTPVLLALVVVV